MKNIAVLPNRQKARAASAAAEAVRFLRRCGLRILAEEENRDIVDADEYRSLETGLFAASAATARCCATPPRRPRRSCRSSASIPARSAT